MNQMPDLITHEECETILTRYFEDEDFKLVDYGVVPLSDQVEGFLGEHYIIRTNVKRYNDMLAVSFFAKIPPLQHDLQLEYVRTSNAFEKEIFFYEDLMKNFKKYCPTFDESILPKFYFSRNNEIVIMENLQQQNFRVAPFKDTMDTRHIKCILKVLAKFHSASIIYEERKSEELGVPFRLIDKYGDMLTEGFFQEDENFLGHQWHTASRKGILSIINLMDEMEIPKSEFKKRFYELTERCIEIVKPSKVFRNVLSHGDLWLKNVLFRYENDFPAECKLVDFQLMKYNPPAFDVLKIIYQSTTAKQRKQHFDDFLKYYYDNLCKELILGDVDPTQVLSRDQFLSSVRYMLPQCKIETCYYYTYQKFGPEFLKLLMGNPQDFRIFTFIDRSRWMLKYYKPGSVYKKWVDEMMNDIKDMIVQYNITREDCYTILRAKLNTTNYELISYSAKYLEEKTGFLGQHLKLHMNIKLNNEQLTHNFFVKILPQTAFNDFVITTGSFNNEKFMLDDVFTKMSLFGIDTIYECIAHYYYSRTNDIIVLQDLNKIGFQVVDKHKPFNFEEMSVAIKCLAKLHGCTLLLEENLCKTNGHKFRVENQFNNSIRETVYVKIEGHLGYEAVKSAVKGLFRMIDIFPDPDSTITDKQLKDIVTSYYKKAIYDHTSPSRKYRNVICHGDLWPNNIMIKYVSGQPVDCRIVDFQNVRICPPAHDVMSMIYLTTSRKFRANFMSEILNLYYVELGNILNQYNYKVEDIIPLNEFLESCEEYKVFAINFAATMFPIVMLRSEEMESFFSNKELCHETMFIDRGEYISGMCQKDERYKNLLEGSVKDLRVLCENIDSKYIME